MTEVIAAYLKDYAVHSPSQSFLRHTAAPILEWWSGKKLSEVNGTNCRRYVAVAHVTDQAHRGATPRSRRFISATRPPATI